MTATISRHLNEQEYKFSMRTTGSHVRCLMGEKGVRLLSLTALSLLSREDLYLNIHTIVGFFLAHDQ